MSEHHGIEPRKPLARGLKVLLDIVFYLVLATGALWLVSIPVTRLSGYDGGWDVAVPVVVGDHPILPLLPLEVAESVSPAHKFFKLYKAQGELRFLSTSFPLHLGVSAAFLLAGGALLWGLYFLRCILATAATGRPFDPQNPRRLRALGWIIVSGALAMSLLQYIASWWTLSRIEVTTIPLSPLIQINEGWVICGLLLLVLANIWRQAVEMAEEQSLTV